MMVRSSPRLIRTTAFAVGLALLVALPPAAAGDKKTAEKGKANRLAKESSAYLLQHAHNPVDWFPWGPEAFEKARKENKLVFLSIGYSSCHWCHVMERESFENAAVAKELNEHFVCIKVDREERPDIDDIYMTALTTTGESGGWPLSMFLTPDGKPIFGGTYIPPQDKDVQGGKILGFNTVLTKVLELHKEKRKEIFEQADKIAEMTKDELERGGRLLVLAPLDRSFVTDVASSYEIDPEWGGLGSKSRDFQQTKFPRVSVWLFLLRQSRKPGQEKLAQAVEHTLRQMAQGGIYDQLGGGFHRYSTERTWTVPHFEKMLYDNAQLVELYSEAYRIKPDPLYKRVVAETLGFVQREMTSPDGGFYSALDADSNGREGEFYVWTLDELKAVLANADDLELIRKTYAVGAPNFEEKEYVLRLPKPTAAIAADLKTTEPALLARLGGLKAKLLAARAKRVRPFLDTKIVTGWNAQMIAAFAKAGQVFGEKAWTETAARSAQFLLANLRTPEGRLLRTYGARPGEKPGARINAFLDDYAYLLHAFLALHDATGEKRWKDEARVLADDMIRWYGDADRGAFFFTAHDHEKLFARSRDSYDGAQPSGNGMAARGLLTLAAKTGDAKYRDQAQKSLKLFAGVLKTNPGSAPMLAFALDEFLDKASAVPLKINPLAPPVPGSAKKPKAAEDVVKGELKLEPAANGSRAFTISLTIDAPYHVYANPVGHKELEEAATRVEAFRDGKPAEIDTTFPPGSAATDEKLGKYAIYKDRAVIRGTVKDAAGPLEFRVRVTACQDGACLLPSTLKLTAK